MIRIRFKPLLDDKAFRERRKIILSEVVQESGISSATLSRIANTPGYNATLENINALCKYFDCSICDLLEFIKDD
jgi:putative transcriptional regulator